MDEVKKAKLKAEIFLRKIVESNFEELKLKSEGKSQQIWENCPLRFEAHAYLENRDEKIVPSFAREIRNLWFYWIELFKRGKLGKLGPQKIFWPSDEEYLFRIDPDSVEREPGFEIEN